MLGNSKESMAVDVDEETKAGGGVFFLSLFLSSFALRGVWGGQDGIGRIVVEIIQLSFALCFFLSLLLLSFAVFGKENH